jgi:hypothetical protein
MYIAWNSILEVQMYHKSLRFKGKKNVQVHIRIRLILKK